MSITLKCLPPVDDDYEGCDSDDDECQECDECSQCSAVCNCDQQAYWQSEHDAMNEARDY